LLLLLPTADAVAVPEVRLRRADCPHFILFIFGLCVNVNSKGANIWSVSVCDFERRLYWCVQGCKVRLEVSIRLLDCWIVGLLMVVSLSHLIQASNIYQSIP
jgi:hypothetical protein